MAKKGVKMNLAEFAGGRDTDLPSAPSEGGYSGGYGGRSGGYGGDRGGDRGYGGDREDRAPRRRYDEEEAPPSRADEADRWRRSGPPPPPERSSGGYGDRRYGDRDSSRFGERGGDRFGDRDGGRFGGDRFGDRDRSGGDRFAGDRDRFGGSGRDDRPSHLRFGRAGDAPRDEDRDRAPETSPSNDRFRRDPDERAEREERDDRDREGPYRPRDRFGGEREGGRFGDRDGGRFGDRDSGRFGDRDGGRFGDRDGGRFGGDRGDRFGDRGGDRFGDRGGDRFGDRPTSRYGGYGGARSAAPSYDEPLPTGPASRQQDYAERKPLQLKKTAAHLAAKPQSMEERKVEVDESLKKEVVSIAAKLTPLEAAVDDNSTISDAQLSESMSRLKLDKAPIDDYANVLAKSLVDGSVSVAGLVAAAQSKNAPQLVQASLSAYRSKKGDKALLDLVAAAQSKEPTLNVLSAIAAGKSGAELDALLESSGLLALKPIPDLSEDVSKQLSSGTAPDAVLASINSQVESKLNPGVKVAVAVAQALMSLVYKDGSKPDLSLLPAWSALVSRVAPASDSDAQLRFLFETQAAWFKAGASKAALKEVFVALFESKLIAPESFDAWRNDVTEKLKNGKAKALLQVHQWITDIQPKQRVPDEPESDVDEELEQEYGERD